MGLCQRKGGLPLQVSFKLYSENPEVGDRVGTANTETTRCSPDLGSGSQACHFKTRQASLPPLSGLSLETKTAAALAPVT